MFMQEVCYKFIFECFSVLLEYYSNAIQTIRNNTPPQDLSHIAYWRREQEKVNELNIILLVSAPLRE